MSDSKMEQLKNKIRKPVSSAVHSELIDTTISNQTKPQKKKFEDLYRRDTFWLKNELKDKLDQHSINGGRGEKTRIINEALELYFKRL